MKKIIGLLMLITILLSFCVKASTYYVSTSGNDSNPGTIESPFATWEHGFAVLTAGDILYIRGGNYQVADKKADYRLYMNGKSGTSSDHIKILAYPGENPVLDFTNITQTTNSTAFRVEDCSWIDFKGLRLTGLAQQPGNQIGGWFFFNSHDITLELCEVDHLGGAGFATRGGCNNFTYTNCDSHDNADPYTTTSAKGYGNADGFDVNEGTAVYIGCRAWWNSDDGFDCFYTDAHVYYRNCWSFWNGYIPGTFNSAGDGNGFKLGLTTTDQSSSIRRTVANCLVFQNKSFAFNQNIGECIMEFYNNTSYDNPGGFCATGWGITPAIAHIFKNNISYNDGQIFSDPTNLVSNHNSWDDGEPVSDADFQSVSPTDIIGLRQADGSLPATNFLHLISNSKFIDAGIDIGLLNIGLNIGLPFTGINVGLPFAGTAPDLGAFEYSSSVANQIPPANQPPVADAGTDINITLPIDNVTLTGKGSDIDGTVTSYQWSMISGPSQLSIITSDLPQTEINNLVQGVYQFELKITDNLNTIAKDTIQVTVDTPIPTTNGKFIKVNIYGGVNPYNNKEWNNWNIMASGNSSEFNYSDGTASQISATSNSDANNIVDNLPGYKKIMALAEVLRYASESSEERIITISGLTIGKNYDIELYASRSASAANTTIFKIDQVSETIATNDNFTNTAAFENFTPDAQGQIIINISSPDKYNYLNGFMITESNTRDSSLSGAVTAQNTRERIIEEKPLIENESSLKIYPNPVSNNFNLELNNNYTGKMTVQIIDQSGAIRHSFNFNKDQQNIQLNLPAADLSTGVYFIRVQIGTWNDTRKLVKL